MNAEISLSESTRNRLDAELSGVFSESGINFSMAAQKIRQLRKKREHRELAYFGSKIFPQKPRREQLKNYGQIFEKWAESIFKALERTEAQAFVGAVCDEDIQINGSMAWNVLFRAASKFSALEPDGTYDDFHFVSGADQNNITVNVHGASSVRPLSFVKNLRIGENPLGFSDVFFHAGNFANVDLIHFVSCDWNYWVIFHERLLSSLATLGLPAIATHVHIMNPEMSLLELNEYVHGKYPAAQVSISGEQLYIPEEWRNQWDGYNLRALYTFLRFKRANDIIEHYNKPIVISEFDAEIGPRVVKAAAMRDSCDIALAHMKGTQQDYFPWNQIWAGTLFANSTQNAKRFFDLVAAYCETVFVEEVKRNRPLWHVDQNALFFVAKYLEGFPGQCRVGKYANDARPVAKNFGNVASLR